MKTIEEWIYFFSQEVPNEITATRWEHCLRVANIAENLAKINKHEFPRKAYLVGIIHDITKQKKIEFHLNLFQQFQFKIPLDLPEEAYHAYSAPMFLRKQYHFDDEEMCLAIQSHTLGHKQMTLLEKILYASDFLGSDFALKQNQKEEWLLRTELNLDYGIYLKSTKTINQLIEKRSKVNQSTIDTYNQIVDLIH